MLPITEDINTNSEIRKLLSFIDFKDDVELKFYDSRNQAVLQKGKNTTMISILNKFSYNNGKSFASEVRKGSINSRAYDVLYRSEKTIGEYDDEDYNSAINKLKQKIKSYLK